MSKKSAKKSPTRSTEAGARGLPSHALAAPSVGSSRLWLALGASVLFHALLLTLHFKFPDASRTLQDKALDIILVNSKAARKPTDAQALAQTNLDGGGNTDDNQRAKTPLPPSAKQKNGSELEQAQKRVQALEAQQQRLLAQARSQPPTAPGKDQEAQSEPVQGLSGRDLASNALAMARFEGEISQSIVEYNKRPRLKTISPRTVEYAGAAYLDSWSRKVERIGTLNFPAQAKGSVYGVVTVWVVLRGDGSLYKFEIQNTSGHKILDEAARRIVEMGAPYGAMPKAMLEDADVVGFSRRLEFTNSNQLQSKIR